MDKETKKCPYCGGEIKATAKKCKHCGQWIEAQPSENPSGGSDKTGLIMVISIIAIIAIVLAASFFFVGRNDSSGDPVGTESKDINNEFEDSVVVDTLEDLPMDELDNETNTSEDSEIPSSEDVEEWSSTSSEGTDYDELNIN